MSTEASARQSFDMALSRITEDLARHLDELRAAWETEADLARAVAVDEARSAFDADLARRVEEATALARQSWDGEVEARIRDAVEDARAAWDGERSALQAQTHQAVDEQVARAVADARAEADAARQEVVAEFEAASAAWALTEQQLQSELQVAESQITDAVEALAMAERSAFTAARENMKSGIAQLLAAVERLDGCASLKTTVDGLAQSLAVMVPRSMVFLTRGDDLRGWHLHGFTEAPDPLTLTVPVATLGQLAEVVTSGRPRRVGADTFTGPLAFAAMRESRWGLGVPVVLGHATVAVIYADDGGSADRMSPAGWEELIQVLARHASRHLEALTAARSVRLTGTQRPATAPVSGMLSGTPREASADVA